jgi:hypothetical protein
VTVGEAVLPKYPNLHITVQILNFLGFPMVFEIVLDKWLEGIWKATHFWDDVSHVDWSISNCISPLSMVFHSLDEKKRLSYL